MVHTRTTAPPPTCTFRAVPRVRKTAPNASRPLHRVPKIQHRFDWSHSGQCFVVHRKPLVYRKPNGKLERTNVMLPKLLVKKSRIRGAGKGVYAGQRINPRQIISKYGGLKVGLCDAIKRKEQVVQTFCPDFLLLRVFAIRETFNCVTQGNGSHIKRIGNSNWCIDSKDSKEIPTQEFADNHEVAGFCNTKSDASKCNAKFDTVDEEVILVGTDAINPGEEILPYYYDSKVQIALAKRTHNSKGGYASTTMTWSLSSLITITSSGSGTGLSLSSSDSFWRRLRS